MLNRQGIKRLNQKGFTLVELLLVIVIMGIISLAVLKQFDVSEKTAKDTVGNYNQAAVESALSDYKSVHGVFPCGYHTGFDAAATASVPGISEEMAINMAADGAGAGAVGAVFNDYTKGCTVNAPGVNITTLSAEQQQALREYGIHRFAEAGYGFGTVGAYELTDKGNAATLDTDPNCWVLTGGTDLYRGGTLNFDGSSQVGTEEVTINGKTLASWNPVPWGTGLPEAVVLVYVTADVNWNAVWESDPDATGYGSMIAKSKIALNKPAKDTKAVSETNFPYYLAAFYLSPDNIGSKVGYSCELLGVLDCKLNPINS